MFSATRTLSESEAKLSELCAFVTDYFFVFTVAAEFSMNSAKLTQDSRRVLTE